jgi:hypothetical protein
LAPGLLPSDPFVRSTEVTQQTWNGKDRRRESRLQADTEAYLRVEDALLPSARFMGGRVTGVSAKGMQLCVGFILPNETVQVRLADMTAFGRVRYCFAAGDHFRVGVQLSRAF